MRCVASVAARRARRHRRAPAGAVRRARVRARARFPADGLGPSARALQAGVRGRMPYGQPSQSRYRLRGAGERGGRRRRAADESRVGRSPENFCVPVRLLQPPRGRRRPRRRILAGVRRGKRCRRRALVAVRIATGRAQSALAVRGELQHTQRARRRERRLNSGAYTARTRRDGRSSMGANAHDLASAWGTAAVYAPADWLDLSKAPSELPALEALLRAMPDDCLYVRVTGSHAASGSPRRISLRDLHDLPGRLSGSEGSLHLHAIHLNRYDDGCAAALRSFTECVARVIPEVVGPRTSAMLGIFLSTPGAVA